ncbi:MAG: DUF2161 family putative PD-(D/E)XK-type phosphodiesterase [Salaquimonas sp.]
MATNSIKETDLYQPVKALLEGQGYEVKGEIGAVDVMAVRSDEEPIVIELKTGFSLSLFQQAVERLAITDQVYMAVPYQSGKIFQRSLKRSTALCRRLGLGLITVRLKDSHTQIHCDPGPYAPRKSKLKKARLLKEFAKRMGDPSIGGATRQGLMTAYRQDALKCAIFLQQNGPSKGALVAKGTITKTATRIMADNHYGWFQRVKIGIYELTPKGIEALSHYQSEITAMERLAE